MDETGVCIALATEIKNKASTIEKVNEIEPLEITQRKKRSSSITVNVTGNLVN